MAASVPSTSAAQHWRPDAFLPSIQPMWRRRLRIVAIAATVLLALYAALGFLAVPWIAKRQIESLAATELGRHATVGAVRFNPFTLRARISDFALADIEPRHTLLAFDLLDVNLSSDSIWRRAVMVEEAQVVRPRLRIALDAAGGSNVRDLVERATARRSGGGESAFALHNIEVEDGTLVFEDGLRRRTTQVTNLAIGIPFLSNRSGDAQIRVKPHLSGIIDGGARFALDGSTSSILQDVQRAELALNFDELPLPRYAAYAPLPAGVALTGGALTTRLTLQFVTWKGKPRGITLGGMARIDGLAFTRADGTALAAVRNAEVHLNRVDLFSHLIDVERVLVYAPVLDLRRRDDGSLELPNLLARPATPAPAEAREEGAPEPWSWSVAEARLSDGKVQVLDRSVAPPYATTLSSLSILATKLASRGAPGSVEAAFDAQDGAHFAAHAIVDVAAQSASGNIAVKGLTLVPLRPYYANALAVDVRRGSIDAGTDFEAAAGTPVRFTLAGGSLTLADLDVALGGEHAPLVRMARLAIEGAALDLGARTLTLDSATVNDAALRLVREADGRMNFERALGATASPWHMGAGAKAVTEAQWQVAVHRFLAEGLRADFDDHAVQPVATLRMTGARLAAENIDTAPGTRANVDLAARIGTKGRIAVKGTASAQPLAADAAIDVAAIDLAPFQPYVFASGANVVVTDGTLNARGRLAYETGSAGPNVRYAGNVAVNGFASLDQPGAQELMRWKTLEITGADIDTAPFRAAVGTVALDGYYARLILDANAKLNVLQLLKPGQAVAPDAPGAAAAPAQAVPPAAATGSAPDRDIPASIGRVQLTNGEVEYSDFFVKPNYTAHLTDVNGAVSRLAARQEGTVEVTARVNGTAPVDIRGTVDPFASQLRLDLNAKATGVDLPPVSPYAVKYAGYGIEEGKLSMEVHYRVKDGQLAATNKLRLDQLTFGDHVDSPTATKLPVLFLVNLLKDRNGVISLDLPISGTLDDPKFSIWGVVVQIIGNLLTKAATSPFALLGAATGGGEQLAYVEFEPGLAVITPAAETKLVSLSKALGDRPQLKLEAAGRAIPDVDIEGLRRAALEGALRVAKQKDLERKGESVPPLTEIVIGPEDYAKYMKAVYGNTRLPNKPRNFIGIAKDIPQEEMEKLLLAGYPVDDNALRELANERAKAVADWFTTKGNLPAERVFVVAPKIGSEGLKGEGAATRVDFAIR
jgi:uncharacterized protein involved in outer membrane biogenesis